MNSVIRAAFRRDLRRFDQALATFPTGSGERAAQLKAAWEHFAYQLRLHHQDEEAYFWPALRALLSRLGRRGYQRRIAGAWP